MDSETLRIYAEYKRLQKGSFGILYPKLDTQKWKTRDLVDEALKVVDGLTENARRSLLHHLNKVISLRESPLLKPCSRHVYFVTVLKEIVSIIQRSISRHENYPTKESTTFTVPKEIVPVIEVSTSEPETASTFEPTISELGEQSIEDIENGAFLDIIRELLQLVKGLWSKATKDDISVATAAAGKLP